MNEQDGKPWWASRTIWSAIGVLIVAVLQLLGVAVSDAEAAEIATALGDLAIAIFAVTTIWGRIRATQRIEPVQPPTQRPD